MSQILQLFSSKLQPLDQQKVIQVAASLKVDVNHLLAVMYFETAKTLSPTIRNTIGSVGLIQFTRDKAGVDYKTINGKQYKLSDISKMTFSQQMDLVELYYKEVFKTLKITSAKTLTDLYLCTFFPKAVGKTDSYILETASLSASRIANANPIFDKNKDLKITKKEVEDHFKSYYKNYNELFANIDKCSICGKAFAVLLPFLVFFYTLVSVTI